MRRLVVMIGLAAVLGFTACGGGGDDAAPASTTTPIPTTVPVGNDQAATPFCGLARTYTQKFAMLLAVANDPPKLRVATTDAETAIRQAQAQAPAEIKPDVTVVATTAAQVLTALQKNAFDLSRTAEVTKLQDPAFQTSLANLNRYARVHCGLA